MKKISLITVLILTSYTLSAQNTFPASGAVGIGTINPSSELEVKSATNNDSEIHINATSNGDQSIIRFQDAGVETWGFLSNYPGSGKFSLYNYQNGSNSIVLDQTGNVGIGTTSPTEELELVSNEPSLRIRSTDSNKSTTLKQYTAIYNSEESFQEA